MNEIWSKRWVRYGVVPVAVIVAGVLLSAFIASGPFSENEFEKPIEKKTRWIEVPGDSFEMTGYSAEDQVVTIPFVFRVADADEVYVSDFTVFLIWQDDARTDTDTFTFMVYDPDGEQAAAGMGSTGTAMAQGRTNNTELNHVDNGMGWSIEVTCIDARDGYIGPAGIITIPDDGNDFTVRIDWDHYIEHNPDWE
jgi:hypothetical protein